MHQLVNASTGFNVVVGLPRVVGLIKSHVCACRHKLKWLPAVVYTTIPLTSISMLPPFLLEGERIKFTMRLGKAAMAHPQIPLHLAACLYSSN